MSFLSGIGGGSILSLATEAALGVATGGTSLLVSTALKGVMMSIGDQVLQQLGQQLGLPQSVTDFAQAAFHEAAGDTGGAVQNLQEAVGGLQGAAGLSDSDTGDIYRTAQQGVSDAVSQNAPNLADSLANGEGFQNGDIASAVKGKSLLVALAIAMGKVADNKMQQMYADTQKLGNMSSNDKGYASVTGEVQALGQEIGMISNALNNAIKSIGDAGSTLARRADRQLRSTTGGGGPGARRPLRRFAV